MTGRMPIGEDSAAVPLDKPHAHTWNAQVPVRAMRIAMLGSCRCKCTAGIVGCGEESTLLIITAKTQIAHTGRQYCFRNESLPLGEFEVAIVLIPR